MEKPLIYQSLRAQRHHHRPRWTVYIGAYCQVRKVDTAGVISIYAGSSTCGFADNAAAAKRPILQYRRYRSRRFRQPLRRRSQ